MSFRVVVEPVAQLEWKEGANWYEARERALGSRFNRAVRTVLQRIARDPDCFPPVSAKVRKARIIGWPYSAYFAVDYQARVAIIIAVWQGYRDPAMLRRRIK
jgi:hypothetical protein